MLESHPEIYNTIGKGYGRKRTPDPRIALQIRKALGTAKTVCNIGAGAGSYEPEDLAVVAVEPSEQMIAQRQSDFPVVQATAENLPFQDNLFDASLAILTVHHWIDPIRGLEEMMRVSRRQVVMTFDPHLVDSFWLVKDYIPEIIDFDQQRALSIDVYQDVLKNWRMEVIPIPHDCLDGFQAAYWRRPEQYLDPKVRQAISTFAQLPQEIVDRGIKQLESDLESGRWHKRYDNLISQDSMDFGYRLLIADQSQDSRDG